MDTDDLDSNLNGFDWDSAIIRLTAYVVSMMKLRQITSLPKGQEAEDIVMQAIQKFYEGKRKWNRGLQPVFTDFLKSVINSLLWAAIKSKEYRKEKKSEDITHIQDKYDWFNEMECEEIDRQIQSSIPSPDIEAKLVFKALKDGYSPIEIADEYDIPISQVRNAQKRLRRLFYRALPSLNTVKNEA